MAGRIHKKYGSDESMGTLSSSQRSPLYYVESPQSLDVEKLSIHSNSVDFTPSHSRGESSTSRYSTTWKKLDEKNDENDEDDEDVHDSTHKYICCFFGFLLLFALVCFILWAVGRSFKPRANLENIVFKKLDVQFGNDRTEVPTYLLSLNSTITMMYTNPATYFGVHVTSTLLQLRYYDLTLASGQVHPLLSLVTINLFVLRCMRMHQ
ncbi:hypothetical protein MtrunA17_Chr8g0379281 [Medicago truncatula]|uniref:Transmembrane protein n=1 Tax=Medicago truncatula TaxID=3880 RepID=A0A396GNF0_MEDTR|nr:hypothetical protein MtrunA17_Chr8g0379281 [Medicago truncatula]